MSGRQLLRFLGPATLISVGYMDPGNWATDLEGGARFGYDLLWVLLVCNAMALLLQTLSARLGLVAGENLASACRRSYPRGATVALWLLAEAAIIACDLAELVGSAVALKLLFGLPLAAGAVITAVDVFLIFMLERYGVKKLEALVGVLVLTIGGCLAVQLFLARPEPGAMLRGLVPSWNGASLYVAVGILGATVMPHNLYLQSDLLRRTAPASETQTRRALRSNLFSTGLALNVALFFNAAILVLAAAVFGARGLHVADLHDAHALLTPLLGTGLGATLFAVGLLCSGQSATITGTMAGQIVMSGFLELKISPTMRRAVTRGIAVVPALAVLSYAGESGAMPLLIASQVVLSLQLPFAIAPLIRLTSSPGLMGSFAISTTTRWLAIACGALVTAANAALVMRTIREISATRPLLGTAFTAFSLLLAAFLVYVSFAPLRASRARVGAIASARA